MPTVSITGPSTVTPGSQVSYTINYTPTNFAQGDTNVNLQVNLPDGFNILSAIAVPNFPGGPQNPDHFALPSLSPINGTNNNAAFTNSASNNKSVAPLSADTFEIVALAPSNLTATPAPARVTETSDQDAKMVPSGTITAQTATPGPTVTPVADLSVSQVGPTSVAAGKDAIYTITVTNNGPSDSQSVALVDLLTNPNGGAVPSIDLAQTKQLSGSDNFQFDPTTNTFTAATVSGGNSDVIQVAVAVPAGFAIANPANAAIWNTVSVASGATLDPSIPDTAMVKTAVTSSADLAITKVGPSTIAAGTEATYTVTLTNNGPSTAQNVTLTDVLAGVGLTFDTAQTAALTNPDGFSAFTLVTPTSQSGTFSAATVAAGSSDTFRIVVRAASDAGANGSSFSTTATINSTTADSVQTDNTATLSTTLTNSASLSIAETLNPPGVSPITEGTPFTYSLQLANNGPSDAQNVVVNFTLPAQLNAIAPVASLTNPGTGQTIAGVQSGNTLTFTIPTVSAAAGNNTFSGTVTVQGVEKGTAASSATVTSSTPNPNSANNTSGVATTVLEGAIALHSIGFGGTEFSPLSGAVASFTHANGLEPASAFSAVIHWGDGSSSPGTVVQPGGTGTAYLVLGSHTYLGKGDYAVAVTVYDDGNAVSTSTTVGIGETSIPAGTFTLPMTSHVQELMELMYKAPLSPYQLNSLDLTLLVAEFSIVNQLLSSGTDQATAYTMSQFMGQNLFDLYADFVSGHGTSLDDAVTELTTGLLIIGSGM